MVFNKSVGSRDHWEWDITILTEIKQKRKEKETIVTKLRILQTNSSKLKHSEEQDRELKLDEEQPEDKTDQNAQLH